MTRHKTVWLYLCLTMITIVGKAQTRILNKVEDKAACEAWVNQTMQRMTLKQKVGQCFIYTSLLTDNKTTREGLSAMVKHLEVGGILFRGGTAQSQIALTNYAQSLATIPLLITFDGEWGVSMRLKEVPAFPRNRVIGCIQDDSLLYAYGQEVARQCRLLGVHVNFAPVADVDNNPANPVINTRSFGSKADAVAQKVIYYARGLEEGGVLAVAKHFPGHGDTNVDSHHALPVLNLTRQRLDSIELFPFKRAIADGIGGIMTGHLLLKNFDTRPTSLSQVLVKGLLTEELGFQGLIFTDALEMKGASNQKNLSLQAFLAGNDFLLSPVQMKEGIQSIVKAVEKGIIPREEIDRRCRKILTYKYALGLAHQRQALPASNRSLLETPASKDLRERMVNAATVLIKHEESVLPIDPLTMKTTVLTLADRKGVGEPFYQALRTEGGSVQWLHLHKDSLHHIRTRLYGTQRLIVAIHSKEVSTWDSFLTQVAKDYPTTLVIFGTAEPWKSLLGAYGSSKAAVWAHDSQASTQRHVAKALLQKAVFNGRTSVELNRSIPAGVGFSLPEKDKSIVSPESMGMNAQILSEIDAIALEGIAKRAYPGCQILVMRRGAVVYDKQFGHYTYDRQQAVLPTTIYDLASVTKTTATLLALMKLYDDGKFQLRDKIGKYIPALHRNKRLANITIEQLLFHESGLQPGYPFYKELIDEETLPQGKLFGGRSDTHTLQVGSNLYANTTFQLKKYWYSSVPTPLHPLQVADHLYLRNDFKKYIIEKIADLPLKENGYRYSDLNFLLLKEIIEVLARKPLDVFLSENFYEPMGLKCTSFLPLRTHDKSEVAPTVAQDMLRKQALQGYVHDETAATLGGVSGNAGLFSNASELAKVYQMLLNQGEYEGKRYLKVGTCVTFTVRQSANSHRGLGFDRPNRKKPSSSPCSENTPASVFGHTGFTGTCVWADPQNDLVYVFLSNRSYPLVDGSNRLSALNIRPRIQEVIYRSLLK